MPGKIVVGLHTVPSNSGQSVQEWTEAYEQEHTAFPSHRQVHSRETIPHGSAKGGYAYLVSGASPLTEYRFANIPFGYTVWFVWTDLGASGTGLFLHMVNSLRFGEGAPQTVEEAFGPIYDPVPRDQQQGQASNASLSVQAVATLPSGSYAPVPAGTNYTVKCGSDAHIYDYAEYAADISMVVDTNVYNSKRSWVDSAGWYNDGYGWTIRSSTDFIYPSVYTLWYAHLNSFSVSLGQEVGTLSLIAKSGNTGTGGVSPHLHFHVVRNGSEPVNLDPLINFSVDGYPYSEFDCGTMWR